MEEHTMHKNDRIAIFFGIALNVVVASLIIFASTNYLA